MKQDTGAGQLNTLAQQTAVNRDPYIGPRPFEDRDRDLFFGREREAEDLLSLAIAHRTLVIYAQSGAGKTSLINARLLPMLRGEEFEVLPIARVQGLVPASISQAEIANIYLFNTLVSLASDTTDVASLMPRSLPEFLAAHPRPAGDDGLPLPRVIVFDQFEELFTSYPERWQDRSGFFEQVRAALDADPLLRVVLAMREDFIAQLDPYAPLLPGRLRARFRLELLREEAARRAVVQPLGNTQRTFAPGAAARLVRELLTIRVETRPGVIDSVPGEFVEPVQLQVVCQNLWRNLPAGVDQITEFLIEQFGDVDAALMQFYDDAVREGVTKASSLYNDAVEKAAAAAYEKARESNPHVRKQDLEKEIRSKQPKQPADFEREIRNWCETRLITSLGTRGTVYRTADTTDGIANGVLDVLVDKHLIRSELRAGVRWYELSHDRLIEPVRDSNRRTLVQLPRTASDASTDTVQTRYQAVGRIQDRNRLAMLQKVRLIWVDGLLDKSLQGNARINLYLETDDDAVSLPLASLYQRLNTPRRLLSPDVRVIDVFDQFGGSLLILGYPGSGKTTLLLELARDLIARAERDTTFPIPVIFNLSSWSGTRQPLGDWLAHELNLRYDVPRKLAQEWIHTEALLPLLDGLDEVSERDRDACIMAVNAYHKEHGLVQMVVCSRTAEYQASHDQLKLNGAVTVLPLTEAQVENYLEQAGTKLFGLRALLADYAELRELARTPLMLNVMVLTYADQPLQSAERLAPDEARRLLFDTYIESVFRRRSANKLYPPAQTYDWLGWLAAEMSQRAQTIFLIEQMQPDWIPEQRNRWLVTWGTMLVIGVASMLTLLTALWPVGYVLPFILWASFSRRIILFYTLRLSLPALRAQLLPALRDGVSLGLATSVIDGLLVTVTGRGSAAATSGLQFGFFVALISIPIGAAMICLLRALAVAGGEMLTVTHPNEGIRRSARSALVVALAFAFGTLGLLGVETYLPQLYSGQSSQLLFGVIFLMRIILILITPVAVLALGGRTVLQHSILRLLLWRAGHIPLNYAQFLDHAVERILLRRVGGGYIFIHRLLMEHFAERFAVQRRRMLVSDVSRGDAPSDY